MHMATLYVSRPLRNARQVRAWALASGVPNVVAASEMHVTIAFSRTEVDWDQLTDTYMDEIEVIGGPRYLKAMGREGEALALRFYSGHLLWRHREFGEAGASWDWPEYLPHVTLSYDAAGFDASGIEPYSGALDFGAERFAELNEDWRSNLKKEAGPRIPYSSKLAMLKNMGDWRSAIHRRDNRA